MYVVAYGLATTVVVGAGRRPQALPGDVLAGGAMGWFIGDYVYGRRHNRELDRTNGPVASADCWTHVSLGVDIQQM